MQFYNYATRVLLDDLSNIIRCFSTMIAIIISSKQSDQLISQHHQCNSGQLTHWLFIYLARSSNGSSTWRHLISYKNMLRAIENIGVEMSLGLRFYARSELSRVSLLST